ncbi:MAG: electron transfer flavoprotein subunit beta/FixA family protein [Candidatus Cloacimonetes bacterium]|nr:electron transfer flavoprotein subunit beta/FixA family protein [Candidatus Cloacimonadota bacterium]
MEIIVCIKQVPDTTEVKINYETNTLIREGIESIINPFDMYAIEEGLQLKEKYGGEVTVISMGPPQVEKALREALALGVDNAILISDRKFAGADTFATSYTLSATIKKIGGYDIVLFGKQAIDGDTAQVGPGVAAQLGIPQIAFVKKIEKIEGNKITAYRMMESGYDIIQAQLPVAITVVKDINEPRLPSLRTKMKAKKAPIEKLSFEDLDVDEDKIGLDGSPTWVEKIFTPKMEKDTEILEGEPKEVASKLADKLKEIK